MSTIEVQPLTEADVPAKCQVLNDAFRTHPRIPVMWPGGFTADVNYYKTTADLEDLKDANSKLFKAVDMSTGEIIGAADWTLALDPAAKKEPTQSDAPPPENWPKNGNWAMRRFYKVNLERLLKIYLDKKAYIMLNILVIKPERQGQGVGGKLLAWGVAEADRRGVAIAVESTPVGVPIYKKHGFKVVENINADMKEFGWNEPYDEPTFYRIFMIRDPVVGG